MSVGLVVVSHSARLAEGVVEVATQMAPEVRVVAAGGLPSGEIGTDFEQVSSALSDADTGSGVVLLFDLGSAQMTADLAVEGLGDPATAIVADAPVVEGAVAAAVKAHGGAELADVARAASSAAVSDVAGSAETETAAPAEAEVRRELVLDNEVGLHARPAALVARSLGGVQANVVLAFGDKEADAASVLGVMGLGARKGDRIEVRATGPDAEDAADRIRDLASRNFDE